MAVSGHVCGGGRQSRHGREVSARFWKKPQERSCARLRLLLLIGGSLGAIYLRNRGGAQDSKHVGEEPIAFTRAPPPTSSGLGVLFVSANASLEAPGSPQSGTKQSSFSFIQLRGSALSVDGGKKASYFYPDSQNEEHDGKGGRGPSETGSDGQADGNDKLQFQSKPVEAKAFENVSAVRIQADENSATKIPVTPVASSFLSAGQAPKPKVAELAPKPKAAEQVTKPKAAEQAPKKVQAPEPTAAREASKANAKEKTGDKTQDTKNQTGQEGKGAVKTGNASQKQSATSSQALNVLNNDVMREAAKKTKEKTEAGDIEEEKEGSDDEFESMSPDDDEGDKNDDDDDYDDDASSQKNSFEKKKGQEGEKKPDGKTDKASKTEKGKKEEVAAAPSATSTSPTAAVQSSKAATGNGPSSSEVAGKKDGVPTSSTKLPAAQKTSAIQLHDTLAATPFSTRKGKKYNVVTNFIASSSDRSPGKTLGVPHIDSEENHEVMVWQSDSPIHLGSLNPSSSELLHGWE